MKFKALPPVQCSCSHFIGYPHFFTNEDAV